MATGQTRWADITSVTNDIYEGALFTLRQQNLLARTVTVFRDTAGMQPRKVTEYGIANPRQVAEGEDVTPTKFDRTLLNTLTPYRHADMFLLTDERVATDAQNVRLDAAMELGASFAQDVDEKIASLYGSLTGGTIGTAGGTITWAKLIGARSLMQGLKIPGPYWCALHPYQWAHLVTSAVATGSEIANAPGFQDALVNSYFVSSILGGVFFVVTPSIMVDANADAVGAMYSPMALAYDERQAFRIEPERDASRQATELNANMWYAYGTWAPTRGIALVGDATTPS